MESTFEGKNILVTGAGRGIGQGIASSLAAAGAKVYALDSDKGNLDDLVKEIPTITAIHQDLEDWEKTCEVVSNIDNLDGLVNCAAQIRKGAAIDETKENIDIVLDVNLKAAINLMQVVGKKMIAAGKGGSIVNISSVSGARATNNLLAYCVAKAGVEMATKVFALELGPNKIRVNALAPTATRTEGYEMFLDETAQAKVISMIPMGRVNEIDDVVQCVVFLLSDNSKMITGTTITVDGGTTCYLPV